MPSEPFPKNSTSSVDDGLAVWGIPRRIYFVFAEGEEGILDEPKPFLRETEAIQHAQEVERSFRMDPNLKIVKEFQIRVVEFGVENHNSYRDMVGSTWSITVKPQSPDRIDDLRQKIGSGSLFVPAAPGKAWTGGSARLPKNAKVMIGHKHRSSSAIGRR